MVFSIAGKKETSSIITWQGMVSIKITNGTIISMGIASPFTGDENMSLEDNLVRFPGFNASLGPPGNLSLKAPENCIPSWPKVTFLLTHVHGYFRVRDMITG
ncbi:MAG: hypothetical protein ACMUIA_10205 [bacterium]